MRGVGRGGSGPAGLPGGGRRRQRDPDPGGAEAGHEQAFFRNMSANLGESRRLPAVVKASGWAALCSARRSFSTLATRVRTGLNSSIGKLNKFRNSDNFCNFPNYFVDFQQNLDRFCHSLRFAAKF